MVHPGRSHADVNERYIRFTVVLCRSPIRICVRTAAAGEDEPNRGRWVNFGPPGPPWEMSKMSRREYDGDGSGGWGRGSNCQAASCMCLSCFSVRCCPNISSHLRKDDRWNAFLKVKDAAAGGIIYDLFFPPPPQYPPPKGGPFPIPHPSSK